MSTISFVENTDHFRWSFYTEDYDNPQYISGDYPVTIIGRIEGQAAATPASVSFTLQIRNYYCDEGENDFDNDWPIADVYLTLGDVASTIEIEATHNWSYVAEGICGNIVYDVVVID